MHAVATGRTERYAWCVVIAAFAAMSLFAVWTNGLRRVRTIVDPVDPLPPLPNDRRSPEIETRDEGKKQSSSLWSSMKRRRKSEDKMRDSNDSAHEYPSAEHREMSSADDGGDPSPEMQLADVGGLCK